ncbi:hypothetical protein ES702_02153 [subsurface metagenome]
MSQKKRWRMDGSGNVGQHTAEQAGDFLFDLGKYPDGKDEQAKWISKALDQKTRVMGKSVMAALLFYDILHLGFESEAARVVGNAMKRLLIGKDGLGRDEAKAILMQNLPREIEIETGVAE